MLFSEDPRSKWKNEAAYESRVVQTVLTGVFCSLLLRLRCWRASWWNDMVKKIDCEDAVVGAVGPCGGDSPPLLSTATGPAQRCQVTGCGGCSLYLWWRLHHPPLPLPLSPSLFVICSVADPWHFGVDPDPDPTIFVIDLQGASKKLIF